MGLSSCSNSNFDSNSDLHSNYRTYCNVKCLIFIDGVLTDNEFGRNYEKVLQKMLEDCDIIPKLSPDIKSDSKNEPISWILESINLPRQLSTRRDHMDS